LKIKLIDYQESYLNELVTMWIPSKELAFGQNDIHTFEQSYQFVKNVLSKKNDILLAKKDNKIVGITAFTKDHISQLYVDVNFLNRGIGTKLLNKVKELSNGKLDLYTFQRNKIAIKFYENHGFFEIGRNFENEMNLPDIKYMWESKSKRN